MLYRLGNHGIITRSYDQTMNLHLESGPEHQAWNLVINLDLTPVVDKEVGR